MALFSFGRTIHCTCGARVGMAPRVLEPDSRGPRFIADAMLGRLARWLRILGYDTVYEDDIGDAELVRRALDERRAILTRDRGLPEEWRVSDVTVVESEDPLAQLREVAARLRLVKRARLFSRCSRCNTPLGEATTEEVRERVPPRVVRERSRFLSCRGCGRVYWEGSHFRHMRDTLEKVLGPLGA